MLKRGDKVRFLNEIGEGIVSRVVNGKLAYVTIEDGFEIPFPINQLVKIFSEDQVENSDVSTYADDEEPDSNSYSTNNSLYLAFEPENFNQLVDSSLHLFFVNDTPYEVSFSCFVKDKTEYKGMKSGKVKSHDKVYIGSLDQTDMKSIEGIIDLLFYTTENIVNPPTPSRLPFLLKKDSLYQKNNYEKNNFTSGKALLVKLKEVDFIQQTEKIFSPLIDSRKKLEISTKKKEAIPTVKKSKKSKVRSEMEVDLHIEELIDNHKGMSNSEIIQIQLAHFQKALDYAIYNNIPKLICIHGVGTGRLRSAIHTLLKTYPELRFQDASYQLYGFGATEIIIHQQSRNR